MNGEGESRKEAPGRMAGVPSVCTEKKIHFTMKTYQLIDLSLSLSLSLSAFPFDLRGIYVCGRFSTPFLITFFFLE